MPSLRIGSPTDTNRREGAHKDAFRPQTTSGITNTDAVHHVQTDQSKSEMGSEKVEMANKATFLPRLQEMWRWRVERACPSLSENHHLYAGNEGATPSTSFTQRVASFTTDAHSLRSTRITPSTPV